jgi:hypothetical protein
MTQCKRFSSQVATNDGFSQTGEHRLGCDGKKRVSRGSVAARANTFHYDTAFEARPAALPQPGGGMDDGGGSGLDAATIAVDRFFSADADVLESFGLLLGNKEFDILVQAALVISSPDEHVFSTIF